MMRGGRMLTIISFLLLLIGCGRDGGLRDEKLNWDVVMST
jgi:hypothetical protein